MNSIKKMTIAILVLMIVVFYWTFIRGIYVSTETISIHEVNVVKGSLEIKGSSINSGMGFTGYEDNYLNGVLVVKPRFTLVNSFNNTGDFNININHLNDVEKIILQGKNSKDTKLIWERN